MKLQPPDQLSTALMWVAAIYLALKQSVEGWPKAAQALPWMLSAPSAFVPITLMALAFLWQAVRSRPSEQAASPVSKRRLKVPAGEASRKPGEVRKELPRDVQSSVSNLLATEMPEDLIARNLHPYAGWYTTVEARLVTVVHSQEFMAAICYVEKSGVRGPNFMAFFANHWWDALSNFKEGDRFVFAGRIEIASQTVLQLKDCRLI